VSGDNFLNKYYGVLLANDVHIVGDITLQGCTADSTNRYFLSINNKLDKVTNARINILANTISCGVQLYDSTQGIIPAGSADKILIAKNTFNQVKSGINNILLRSGARIIDNDFNLYNSTYAIKGDVFHSGADTVKIHGNNFFNLGGANAIDLSGATHNKLLSLVDNSLVGVINVNIGSNTYNARLGNYSTLTKRYDYMVADALSATGNVNPSNPYPNMTAAERGALSNLKKGDGIFDTDLNKLMIWDGTTWNAAW
jgi:hypothetical protein